ncbi:MAG: hypothetical protein L0Y58_06205 [Verrucomicrobia subdivision 3 bacterium]|nr:hypothetical protein [Limisphaerales bacterium]
MSRSWVAISLFSATTVLAMAVPVHITVVDEAGHPMPARVHLKDSSGKPQRADKLPFWRDHFVCDGRVDLELAAGSFSYEIERGPEFRAASESFTAGTGGTNISVMLARLTDLKREGWWSGELHVHRAAEETPLLMQAEDLHVAHNITWWNESNLWKDRSITTNPLTRFDRNRFLHVLSGEDERGGGALLYLNLPLPLDITGSRREVPSSMKFLREARVRPGAHVDIEKPFWWDTPLWLASGMVNTVGIAHNHMHRSGVLDNEAWGRARDRHKYSGPQGNGRYTQDIYYHALNCGLRVAPSAGSASGVLPNPVGYNRVYVHCANELTWEGWHRNLRAGRSFVSNGPLLRCRANGELPGHVFRADGPLEVKFDVKLDSRNPIASIEIVRNGQAEPLDSTRPFTIAETGWFLVRAIGDVTNTFRFASTAPWYVEIDGRPRAGQRESAQYFLDWCRERIAILEQASNLTGEQREEVIAPWRDAQKFWQTRLTVRPRP